MYLRFSLWQAEWRYLLSGGMPVQELTNPAVSWLSERAWQDILGLSALDNFSNLAESFTEHLQGFKRIFDSNQPHRHAHITTMFTLVSFICAVQKLLISNKVCVCVRLPTGSLSQESGTESWTHSRGCWSCAV